MPLRRPAVVLIAALPLAASALTATGLAPVAAAVAPVALHVDASVLGPVIDPAVYGASFAGPAFVAAARPGLVRWGGNATSRYDYRTDSTNRGSDWYFENTGPDDPPAGGGNALDAFVTAAVSGGAEPAVTVPALGWVAKDQAACGFPVTTYGAQQDADTLWRPNCGNGRSPGGSELAVTQPASLTSVAFSHADQQAMVAHVSSVAAASTRAPLYLIDNEPALWNSTHRDVRPAPVTGTDLFALSTATADAIVAGDPDALVAGPGDWGYCAYFYYPADPGGCSAGADRTAHGGLDLAAAYLAAFQAHDSSVGHRTLDVLDEHIYPQGSGVYSPSVGDAATQALRLRSTRALWDPTYTDESWISDLPAPQVQLLPRMQQWIDTYYPGTGIGIGEYSFGAADTMNGALAQADALGILGRAGVRYAALWTAPASATSPTTYAFRMFRNLDGNGAGFGTQSVRATSDAQDTVSVYAAKRADGTLTVVLVNKAMSGSSYLDSPVTLDLAGLTVPSVATRYTYSVADPTATLPAGGITTSTVATSAATSMTLPAASITTLVLGAGPSLGLASSAATTTYPGAVRLTARLAQSGTPVTGGSVRFYSRPVGTTRWTVGPTVTTDVLGRAFWAVRPSYSTEFIALDVRAGTKAPASTVVRVRVVRAVSISLSSTSARLGATVRFAGRVAPVGPAHKVSLQRKVGTTWRTVATTTTTASSTWSVSLRQAVRGTQYYRAVVAGDSLHLAGASATRTVRVL